jgi:hypothetical protein
METIWPIWTRFSQSGLGFRIDPITTVEYRSLRQRGHWNNDYEYLSGGGV